MYTTSIMIRTYNANQRLGGGGELQINNNIVKRNVPWYHDLTLHAVDIFIIWSVNVIILEFIICGEGGGGCCNGRVGRAAVYGSERENVVL